MDVRRVDLTDTSEAGELHAWWAAGAAAARHDRADLSWPLWSGARLAHTVPEIGRENVLLLASEGEQTVGQARIVTFTDDNPHLVFADLSVVPQARGRGIGTALLGAVEETVRAAGRTTILVEVVAPPGFDPTAGSTYDLDFARAHGYAVAQLEDAKVVDLAATAGRWPELAAHAAERQDDYRLAAWADRVPDEHLEQMAGLYGRFLGEIPLGEMELEPQTWSAERLRRVEERWARVGRHRVTVVAVAPDGTLAGYTDAIVTDGRPERAEIDGTLVLPEHRGHRLGLALKVRLHEEVRARFPDVTRIATDNAETNTWMNAVNDQLGYVVVERIVETQKVLGATPG